MVKSALYKHYKSKRDIFDSILERMDEMDSERVKKYEMPEGNMDKIVEAYKELPFEQIQVFSKAQFQHWTQEEFFSSQCLLEKSSGHLLFHSIIYYILTFNIDI